MSSSHSDIFALVGERRHRLSSHHGTVYSILRWVTSVCSNVMILPKTTPKAVFMEHIIVSKELSFIQSGESICFFFF